jgi:DNA-binding NarL/FixJ family response regulator
MSDPRPIRVLIADDHPVYRMGLRALIEAEPDMIVVAEAADGAEAIERYAEAAPDVGVLDLRMPRVDGPAAIQAIRKRDPGARLIVLTTYDGDSDVARAVQAGACGYLLKGTFRDATLLAIREAAAGRSLITPELAGRAATAPTATLTAREIEVLSLLAKGYSNKEVGAALFVAEGTVRVHVSHIFEKLDVSDRTTAVLLAIRQGLIRID